MKVVRGPWATDRAGRWNALPRISYGFCAVGAILLSFAPRTSADNAMSTVVVHAVRYEFEPSEITLKRGRTVKLIFIAEDLPHGIAIDGLGIDLTLPKHKAQALIITPAALGNFEGECSKYCGTGHRDMTFTVHVIP